MTLLADLDLGGTRKITGVGTAIAASDVANKNNVDSKHDLLNNEITKINNRFSALSTLRSFAAQILCASAGYCKVTYNGVSSDTVVSLSMPPTWGSEFDSVTVGGVNVRFSVYNDTNASTYFFSAYPTLTSALTQTPGTTRRTLASYGVGLPVGVQCSLRVSLYAAVNIGTITETFRIGESTLFDPRVGGGYRI